MSDPEQPSMDNPAVNQPNITTPPIFTSKVPIPPNINLKGDLKQNWKQWKQIWDAYEFVTNLNQQSTEYRVATFITCIGHEALKIHSGLPFKTEDEKKDIAKILEFIANYSGHVSNIKVSGPMPASASSQANYNMAARKRNVVDYSQLNNFSSVVLYDTTSKRKRKTLPSMYMVERIISKRRIKNDNEYLIKWDGWPLESCTWEPSSHLGEELLRAYEKPPKPSSARLHEASRQFYQGILASLRSKSTSPVYVPMELDIWQYITNGKGMDSNHRGYRLYSITDLSRLPLPEYWWYYLNSHGEGHAVTPPLKIKPFLSWTSSHKICRNNELFQVPQMPLEKLCIDIVRRPCNIDNFGI